MAAETAQAEVPAPPPPPPPAPGVATEKRGLQVPGEAEEELPPPEPKRRRACVAALDAVPCAAAAAAEKADASGPVSGCDADGASFSFHHARGGFVTLEATPKFGSFNPPAEAAADDLKPASPPDGEASPEADEEVPARGAEDSGTEENSQSQSEGVEADGQGRHADENDDPVLTSDQS